MCRFVAAALSGLVARIWSTMTLSRRNPATLAALTRLSLIAVALFVVFFGAVPYIAFVTEHVATWPVVVAAMVSAPACVLGLLSVLWAPALRMDNTPAELRRFAIVLRMAIAVTVLGMVCGLGLVVWADVPWRWVGLLLCLWTSMFAGYAVIPWVSHSKLLTLAVILALIYPAQWLGLFVWVWPVVGAISTWFSRWTFDVLKAQQRSHEVESALQLSQERLRIAQELHDSLGQQLAAMSLKTQLATAFADADDPRLHDELRDLQALIRDSSEQMRDVVRGYRTVSAAVELQGARSLLESGGVEVKIVGELPEMEAEREAMIGWFIREAATNVVRHARASWVSFGLTPQAITITNDGAGDDMRPLSGLETIRRRCAPLGATLNVTTGKLGEFAVTMRWVDVETGPGIGAEAGAGTSEEER